MNVKKSLASILSGLLIVGSVSYSPQTAPIVSPSVTFAESNDGIEVWDGKVDTSWYDDQETEFHIYNAQQLAGIASLTNTSKKTFEGKTIYIENDIYFNDVNSKANNWTSIGTFKGTFDGQSHYFYNYYSNTGALFAGTEGKICNINLINSNSYGNGICGQVKKSIENCYYQGKIESKGNAGGICSSVAANGLISNCVFNGEIYISGTASYVGGICTYNSGGIINKCHTYGHINNNANAKYIGGICGYAQATNYTISNCSNRLEIKNNKNTYTGGICGCSWGTSSAIALSINNCYNLGNISTISFTSGNDFGGISGLVRFTSVENVYNTGIISAVDQKGCGGIIGSFQSGNIDNAYYLNTSCANGLYGADKDSIKSKSDNNMKSQDFAFSLGEEFVYVSDNYPRLVCEKENEHTRFNTPSLYFDKFDGTSKLELWEKPDSVNWFSSNPQVATVDANGTVTPVSNGNAIIYALYGDEKAVCDVTVCAYSLDKNSVSIEKNSTQKINIISNKTIISPEKATFTSSDTKIAKVDSNGNITGVATGTCVINVTIGDVELKCDVTVIPQIVTTTKAPSIELDKTVVSIKGGEQSVVKVLNYSGSITWVSSDAKIATVTKNSDNSATIKGISKGTATVYAMLGSGKNLVCDVTVTENLTTTITTKLTTTTTKKTTTTTKKTTTTTKKTTTTTKKITTTTKVTTTTPPISIGKTEITMKNGEQYAIPANRNDLTYKSNNNDIAIVSSKGIITAVGTGNAVISVIDSEWNVVQINVTVTTSAKQGLPGDSNMDNQVDLSDVVLIMQSLANPNKYGLSGSDKSHLTEQGAANADVEGGNGITANDALTIQQYLLKIISKLPV